MREFKYKYKKLKEILQTIIEENGYGISDIGEKYYVHQPHDKLIKTVLNEKSQMVGLINKVLIRKRNKGRRNREI